MNIIKEKIAERSDQELIKIIRETEEYPDQVIKVVEEVLRERDIDLDEIKNEKKESTQIREELISAPESKQNQKYRILRFLAVAVKFSTIFIILILGLVTFMVPQIDFQIFIMGTVGVLVILIPYFILSELIYLLIDIEKNLEKILEKDDNK